MAGLPRDAERHGLRSLSGITLSPRPDRGETVTVLLDTDLLPERERADALHAAYGGERPQRAVQFDADSVRHRMERLGLAPDVHLLRTGGSPLDIIRTDRQVRAEAPEYVAIGLHRRGRGFVCTAGSHADLPVGQLNCVDMTRPYRFAHRSPHDHDVLIVSNPRAGVSVDVVRAAASALARSPVYDLVRRHVAGLHRATRGLSAEPRLLTGQATAALVGALLTTAAESDGMADAMDGTLGARLVLFLDAHLADRDLTVESAAAAHHISVRHFYNVWARAGHDRSPAQWIVARRLERAREQLLTADPTRTSIAAVARSCGFADSSHFSRRFREAFHESPKEWRSTRSGAAHE